MTRRSFLQLDVFAADRGRGNPLGVVLDAGDLDTAGMQAIAAWMHENHVLPAPRFKSSQGREVGRDGVVEIAVDSAGDVWIGGQTQTVIEGVLHW